MEFSRFNSKEYTLKVSEFILEQGVVIQRVAHIAAYIIAVSTLGYGDQFSKANDGRVVLTKHNTAKVLGVSPSGSYRVLKYMKDNGLLPDVTNRAGHLQFYLASLEDGFSSLKHAARVEHVAVIDVVLLATSLSAAAAARGGGK